MARADVLEQAVSLRMEPVYVIGHVNPDTDAIAAAMGYAWVLRERDGQNAIAARAGPPNPQTTWVLKTLGLEAPRYLPDASPRFERIARTLPPVNPDRPLREAWAVASASRSGAPVVGTGGQPLGLVTGDSVFRFLSQQMDERLDLDNISVARVLAVPCGVAMDADVPRFACTMRVRDARGRVLRDERDDFFVVDEEGKYFGICRTPDVLNPPRLRLVLVDHNEAGQAVGALDEADLVEVLDHHRLGNPPTNIPIPFTVDPVGSTSTLVTERIVAAPTTTDRDRVAADSLAAWCLGTPPLTFDTVEAYGEAVLSAGSGLAVRGIDAIMNSDLKLYEAGDFKFGIAQVEVANRHELTERLEEIRTGLAALAETKGLNLAVLMVTDVVRGSSRLVVAGPQASQVEDMPYLRLPDGTFDAPDVVSRKKQLLPTMLSLLG
jgi:manganese-dependent inorganic pyrophosphatase